MTIFAFSLVISTHSQINQESSSLECIVAFLRERHIWDEFIIAQHSISVVSRACRIGAESQRLKLLQQAQFDTRNYDNFYCIQMEMENDENFQDWLLNYHATTLITESKLSRLGSVLRLSITPKQRSIARIEKKISDLKTLMRVRCDGMTDFDFLFDSFFGSNDVERFVKLDDEQEFCMKEELVAKRLLDPSEFNLLVIPDPVRVRDLDCTTLVQPLKNEIVENFKEIDSESPEKTKNRCIHAQLTDNSDFALLFMKSELLSRANLTENQKSKEKQNFVEKMLEITMLLRKKCVNLN